MGISQIFSRLEDFCRIRRILGRFARDFESGRILAFPIVPPRVSSLSFRLLFHSQSCKTSWTMFLWEFHSRLEDFSARFGGFCDILQEILRVEESWLFLPFLLTFPFYVFASFSSFFPRSGGKYRERCFSGNFTHF